MSDGRTVRYRRNRGRPANLTAEEEAWLDARSEAEIEAAAAAAPLNPALTAEQLRRARRAVAVASPGPGQRLYLSNMSPCLASSYLGSKLRKLCKRSISQ